MTTGYLERRPQRYRIVTMFIGTGKHADAGDGCSRGSCYTWASSRNAGVSPNLGLWHAGATILKKRIQFALELPQLRRQPHCNSVRTKNLLEPTQ